MTVIATVIEIVDEGTIASGTAIERGRETEIVNTVETIETALETGIIDDAAMRMRIGIALGTGIETAVIVGRTTGKEIEIVPAIGIVIEIAIGILIEADQRNVKLRPWT